MKGLWRTGGTGVPCEVAGRPDEVLRRVTGGPEGVIGGPKGVSRGLDNLETSRCCLHLNLIIILLNIITVSKLHGLSLVRVIHQTSICSYTQDYTDEEDDPPDHPQLRTS